MLTANLKVGKQVGFGDAIRAPDFHRWDFAFVQQLVPRFGADSQGIAHLLDVGEKSAIFPPPKKNTALSPAFCTCASYTKPQPVSFAKCRKRAEGVDKTGELEYKEITTKTFSEHSGIHSTKNGFG